MKPHLFEALLSRQAAEELSRCIPARSVGGEYPLRTFLGEIIDDDVFVEVKPTTRVSLTRILKVL